MDTLSEIQAWYQSQCDGDWEHSWGVTIESMDNPGWSVTVDLIETELEDRSFDAIDPPDDQQDWIQCKVAGAKFIGYGGPLALEKMLRIFLDWAK